MHKNKLNMKILKIIFPFAVIISHFGCIKQAYEEPEMFLSENKMVSIFVDIHIFEAQIELMNLKPDSALTVYRALEGKKIWDKHNINKEQFESNHQYYLNQQEVFEKIYIKVVDSLGVLESKYISSEGNKKGILKK